MSRIAVIGERPVVAGFGLAGADVRPARGPAEVRTAWNTLPADTAVVILTPEAADALRGLPPREDERLTVVMPP